jgi:hypothetical protein
MNFLSFRKTLTESIAKTEQQLKASSLKTDEQLNSLTQSIAKTDQQCKAVSQDVKFILSGQAKLIGQIEQVMNYNRNRDEELEEVLDEVFFNALKNRGWNVTRLNCTEIYDAGELQLEWDGIFSAHHPNHLPEKRLFLVETKQVFLMKKFVSFKKRFTKMKNLMNTLHADNEFFCYKDHLLCGVIASPVIQFVLNVTNDNFSSITLKRDFFDQYEVTIV